MRIAALPIFLLPGACATATLAPPDLGALYDAAAQASDRERNPIILVPGLLGSRLEQAGTGRVVWGAFAGDYADPERTDGARLFALPIDPSVPVAELADDVVPAGALESLRVQLLGLPIDVSAYVQILLALGVGGYRDRALGEAGAIDYGDEHFTCFQFDYDWRRDVPTNAARFADFVEETAAYVRAERSRRYGDESEVEFDVVAHSLGGLVLRWYLRYGDAPLADEGPLPELTWAGAARVDRAVLIGTPNLGASKALDELLWGTRLGPFLPTYAPAIVGTLPSAYQLLPRPRHARTDWLDTGGGWGGRPLELYDVETWERRGWGLLDPDQAEVLARLLPDVADDAERRAIAREHLAGLLARAERVHAALDLPASESPGVELYLVAGDAVDTPDRTRFEGFGPGDGTVTRRSALGDERPPYEPRTGLVSPIPWEHVYFFFEDHLGLTQSPAFIDNLLYLLLEEPRRP